MIYDHGHQILKYAVNAYVEIRSIVGPPDSLAIAIGQSIESGFIIH